MRHFLSVSFFVALTGCSGSAQTVPIRGAYVFGHEVRSFHPCGGSSVYWVEASQEISDELRARHAALTSVPYRQIYVVVEGMVSDEPRSGFAADYDGVFTIERLIEAGTEVPGDCVPAG